MKCIVAILGLFALTPITCSGQMIIGEKERYDICYKAFGSKVEHVYADGELKGVHFYPTLVNLRSLITNKFWEDNEIFETMPYDILVATSDVDCHDHVFLVMGRDIIYFDIYRKYTVVVRHLFRILKKYKVDKLLFPLFCERLSYAYMTAGDQRNFQMSEIEKLYIGYYLL